MCGLVSVLDFDSPLDAETLRALARANDQLAPRGPDATGQWQSAEGHLAMAHRRLAIIDLLSEGEQPMHDTSGRYTIVFNGEIYNYRELRAQLAADYMFRSASDTEVIMAAWSRWGMDCLNRLRGMFAFVLWDSVSSTLFAARDPFGIKPLYMRGVGSQLWLASQVKALTLVAPGLTESVAARAGFFLWGSVPEPLTPFEEICALPAGGCIRVGRDQPHMLQRRQWFRFPEVLASAAMPNELVLPEPATILRDAMVDTVRAHRVADVPVGVFLSAGLDSTTLAALSCELADSSETVQTVTLAFDEYKGTPDDESPIAEAVARQLGTTHTTVCVAKRDFAAELHRLFAAMDQPSIDGVNTYFVSQVTRQAGLKVALSGLGGDELFGGYSTFRHVPKLAAVPGWLAELGPVVRQVFGPLLASGLRKPKLGGLLEYSGSFERAYMLRRGLYMPWELGQVMPIETVAQGLEKLGTLQALRVTHEHASCSRIKISLLEAAWYMRNRLLRDSDWASMAHGLELRVPLVDTELWMKVLPLRAANKTINKWRMAQTPSVALPDVVLNRAKTGFSVPVAKWIADVEAAESGQKLENGLRPWALRVWDHWFKSVPWYSHQ